MTDGVGGVLSEDHLVSQSFLGWEGEGVNLGKLRSQVVVQLPELCVPPVYVPLVVLDTDIHLKTKKREEKKSSS